MTCKTFRSLVFGLFLLLGGATLAIAQSKTAGAENPKSGLYQAKVEELRKAAWNAVERKDWPTAIGLWSQILAQVPTDSQALRMRGSAYGEAGRHDLALADAKHATELDQNDYSAWNSLCWVRLLAAQPAQARLACERSVSLEATMSNLVNLGHAWLLEGNSVEARAWYVKSIPFIDSEKKLDDGPLRDFDIFIERGWQAEESRKARAWFAEEGGKWLTKIAPAEQLAADAKIAEAKKDYVRAVALREQSLSLMLGLFGDGHTRVRDVERGVIAAVDLQATQLFAANRIAEALPLYQRVLAYREKQPNDEYGNLMLALFNVARTLLALNQFVEADAYLLRAMTKAEQTLGKDSEITIALTEKQASLYVGVGRFEEALRLYLQILPYREKQAASKPNDFATSLRLAADNAEKIKDWPQAKSLWQRYLAIRPKDASAYSSLSWVLTELEDVEAALAAATQAVTLSPLEAGNWLELCGMLNWFNRPLEARLHCEKALAMDASAGKKFDANVRLGHTYLLAGNFDSARHWYFKALEIESYVIDQNELLGHFDHFVKKGYQAELSRQARAWFEPRLQQLVLARQQIAVGDQKEKSGEMTDAITASRMALSALSISLGKEHVDTVGVMNSLALRLKAAGQSREASVYEKQVRDAWGWSALSLNENAALVSAAKALVAAGRKEEAAKRLATRDAMLWQAYRAAKRRGVETSQFDPVFPISNYYGLILGHDLGEIAIPRKMLFQHMDELAATDRKNTSPSSLRNIGTILHLIGRFHYAGKDVAEARKAWRMSVDFAESSQEGDPSIPLVWLGHSYVNEGRLDEALDYYQKSTAAFSKLRRFDDQTLLNGTVIAQSTLKALQDAGLSDQVRVVAREILTKLHDLSSSLPKERKVEVLQALSDLDDALAGFSIAELKLKEAIADEGLMLAEALIDETEKRHWTLAFLWRKAGRLFANSGRRYESIGVLERIAESGPVAAGKSVLYYNLETALALEYEALGEVDVALNWAAKGYASALLAKDYSSFENALRIRIRELYKKDRFDDAGQVLLEASAQEFHDAFALLLLASHYEKLGNQAKALELRLSLHGKSVDGSGADGEWHSDEERNLIALYVRQQEWGKVRELLARHLDAPAVKKADFAHVAFLEWIADLDERIGNHESANLLRGQAQQIYQATSLEADTTQFDGPAIRSQLASPYRGTWFSPNGLWVLTSNRNGDRLDLWHRETGRRLDSILAAHPVTAAVFLPDNRLVLATTAGTLELWEGMPLRFKKQIFAHTGRIYLLSLSPDGRQLLSYDQNRMRLWQAGSLKSLGGVQPPWVANHLIWLDNEHWLGCNGNADLIFRFSSKGLLQHANTGGCLSLQALGEGQVMYMDDIAMPVVRNGWNLDSRQGLYGLENVSGSGYQLTVSGDMVALSDDEKVRTWKIGEKTLLPGPALSTMQIIRGISPDSRWLYYSSPDQSEQVEVFPLAKQERRAAPLKSSGVQILGLEFSDSGQELWVRTKNDIRAWNFESGAVSTLPPVKSGSEMPSNAPRSALLWAKGARAELHWAQQADWPLIGTNNWGEPMGTSLQRSLGILSDGDQLTLRQIWGGNELVRWHGESTQARWSVGVGGSEELQLISRDGKQLFTSFTDVERKVEGSQIDLQTGSKVSIKGLPKASAIGLMQASSGRVWGISDSESGISFLKLNAAGDAVEEIEPLSLGSCATSRVGRCEVRSARNAPVLAFVEYDLGWVVLWVMRPDLPAGDKRRLVRSVRGRSLRDFALSADGRFLAVLSAEGNINLSATEDGQYLGHLYMFNNDEWAVIDRDQRFDAARAGDIQSMHWVVGMEPVALSQLKARYYEPGLIGKLTGFNKEPLRTVSEFIAPKLYPDVKMVTGASKPLVTQVSLQDQGGGIGRVQILLNGKEIKADARGGTLAPDASQATISVDLEGLPLKPGEENVLEVVAWNREGYLSSRGATRAIMGPSVAVQAPPTLFAIVAGVSEYASPHMNLNFSGKDAADIASALRLAGKRLFGVDHVEVSLLTDAPVAGAVLPNRQNLQSAFASVAKRAKHNDLLVVYLAGHGAMSPGEGSDYYYLTRDARSTDLTDPAVRDAYGVSSTQMTEWIKSIPALKQVMVLDTCAAGGAAEKLTQARALSSDQVRALDRLKDRTGFHVLMGASADKVSYESSQFGQGLLTYAILQGMKGGALRDGEYIDVQTLFQHAADQVPQMAQSIGGIQRPIIASPRGTSFDIGQLKSDDKAEIPLASQRPMFIRANFQDELKPVDSIGLTRYVNSLFKNLSANARSAPIVFIDSDDLPGAFQLAGRYRRKGEQLEIRASIYRGQNELGEFALSGSSESAEKTSCRLVDAALKLVQQSEGREANLQVSACP